MSPVGPAENSPLQAPPAAVGVLCNPRSGRNRRRLAQLRRFAQALPGAVYREAATPVDVAAAVDELLAAAPQLLVVNGGDGSVQAVLTHLLGKRPAAELPPLVVVPGGTTNMTASDLGVRTHPEKHLRILARWLDGSGPSPGRVMRPVLRVEHRRAEAPRYGMFFGAGAIHTGVQLFHQRIRSLGLGGLGPGLAFAGSLAALLGGRDSRLNRPTTVGVRIDGEEVRTQQYLLLLVSALDRLFFGMRPYWGDEPAPLHYTAVRHRPPHLLRSLPAILRGRGDRVVAPDDGYVSRNIDSVELTLDEGFILDGEHYDADAGEGPVRVSAVGPITFLVP